MLETEREFYDKNLVGWLDSFAGRIVLVKGEQLAGVYDTVEEAISEGARQFGLSSFLVRRVEQEPHEARVPALTLGILNANSTHSS